MRKSGTGVAAVLPLVFLSFLAANLFPSSTLHAQATFYQGKSIRFIYYWQSGGISLRWLGASVRQSHYLGKKWICASPGSNREKTGNLIDGGPHPL